MLKSPNKRVWCVLVKGLRLEAETIVGTETTRQVENDKWVRNDLLQMFVVLTLFAAETMFLWLGLLGSNRNWKKTPVRAVIDIPDIDVSIKMSFDIHIDTEKRHIDIEKWYMYIV